MEVKNSNNFRTIKMYFFTNLYKFTHLIFLFMGFLLRLLHFCFFCCFSSTKTSYSTTMTTLKLSLYHIKFISYFLQFSYNVHEFIVILLTSFMPVYTWKHFSVSIPRNYVWKTCNGFWSNIQIKSNVSLNFLIYDAIPHLFIR